MQNDFYQRNKLFFLGGFILSLIFICIQLSKEHCQTDNLYKSFIYLPIYISTISYLTNAKRLKTCYCILSLTGIGMTFYGFAQFLNWLPSGHSSYIVTGTFDNPAGIGMFLAILIPYITYGIQWDLKYKHIIQWIGITCVVTTILLSGSRTGMLATCIGICCPYIKNISRKHIIVLITLGVVICIALYLYKPISANGRLFIAWVSCHLASHHPWTGNGIDGFDRGYMLEQAAFFSQHPHSIWAQVADNVKSPFNEYLLFFIRFGLIGILWLTGIGILLFRWMNRNYHPQKRPAIASLVATLVCGCFSYPSFYIAIVVITVITLAILCTPAERSSLSSRKKTIQALSTGVLLIVGLSGYIYSYYYYEHPRLQLETRSANGEKSVELNQSYAALFQTNYQSHHALFFYNYALHLYENKEYKSALTVLKLCHHYQHDYDGQMLYAYTLAQLSLYKQAIEAFHLASNMLPNRLQPRYELMCLYDQTGETDKALKCAKDALTIPLKISNMKTEYLRTEFRCYILGFP